MERGIKDREGNERREEEWRVERNMGGGSSRGRHRRGGEVAEGRERNRRSEKKRK